jgi:4-aminobutyrate aminotransferase-like enzyme
MFGKARCKVCGEEVRLTLKHFSSKHREIYDVEVTGKMKMVEFMKKYFD